MIFSSITFLYFFLPIVLFLYYIVPKKVKNIVLLITSLVFYAFGEPKYIFVMLFTILSTFIFGLLINKQKDKESKKVFLILAIFINLGILVYFKYFNFIISNINLWLTSKIDLLYVVLPIGISFYTFQTISYLVDVYKGDVKVQGNLLNLATYVVLFPQLIAGPIVRYKYIEEQLEDRKNTVEQFAKGVTRFVVGLGKKVLIANVLGELVNVFLASTDKSVLYYWMYGISAMLQIYFDFSGYSDMAIGLGKMFGFEFPENFNYPFISKSITEFWRRWHMSLGTWFRDYVYIPLGGNRVSSIKHIRNILIVWALTGLWHGAAWNFVIWGVFFGILLIIEKKFLLKFLEKLPKFLQLIYTNFIVMISFIIFNGNGVMQILNNIKGLFGVGGIPLVNIETLYYLKSYGVIIISAIIGATPLFSTIAKNKKFTKARNVLEPIFIALVLVVSTSFIIDGSFNPFLYFRF